MLLKLFLIVSLLCFTAFDQIKAEERRIPSALSHQPNVPIRRFPAEESESGDGQDDIDFDREANPGGADDVDDKDSQSSGDGSYKEVVPLVTVAVNHRDPPSAVDKDKEEEYNPEEDENKEDEDNGGAGIIIDEDQGQSVTKKTQQWEDPVSVEENSLITHPGVLAAIIIGGVLVLVCLVVFFVLLICCVRKKDEGTYDLDEAMKEKLKYVAYTKAETSSDKEFFA